MSGIAIQVVAAAGVLTLAIPLATRGADGISPYSTESAPAASGRIDKLVFAGLKAKGIEPANLCPDEVFVRRAFLDVTGTLPTAVEAKEFIADTRPDKRAALIDELMRRDAFTGYWTMKWCDLLRVKAEFPINLWPNAVQSYERWIRTAVRDNMPYDRFARELLTQNGSNFRVGPVNFYRAVQSKQPEGIAEAVALTFMGTRAEKWPKEKLAGFAGFFSQIGYKSTLEWKEEIVFFDPQKTNAQGAVTRSALLPDGKTVALPAGHDPRQIFADWLVTPDNPWFARAIVNRVWSWLMGRGIVHEPDDLRPDNPPVNPALLAYLEKELVASKWDLRHIFRLILTSQTYQLSCVPGSAGPEGEANFANYVLRRLDAEVLADAINQITGTTERYSSAIPEPFTYIPEDMPSVALGDGSITSSFLEMFGRPSRDSGLEDERSNTCSADQRLHMLNSTHIQRKLEQGPRIQALLRESKNQRDLINSLYLSILSRPPTSSEIDVINTYAQKNPGRNRDAAIDVAWALINSAEFLYKH